jgi:hypothetical protein
MGKSKIRVRKEVKAESSRQAAGVPFLCLIGHRLSLHQDKGSLSHANFTKSFKRIAGPAIKKQKLYENKITYERHARLNSLFK